MSWIEEHLDFTTSSPRDLICGNSNALHITCMLSRNRPYCIVRMAGQTTLVFAVFPFIALAGRELRGRMLRG
jgi:hypothetical protein